VGADVIEKWLVEQDLEQVSAVLDIQVVTADETVDEDTLYDYLGRELLRNYVGRNPFRAAAGTDLREYCSSSPSSFGPLSN
jgi:hypothetical protein